MVLNHVTIFCTAATESDRRVLDAAVRTHHAEIVQTAGERLGSLVLPALALGPVLAVVGSDQEASQALSLGIDEVLRAGEVTEPALDRAVGLASSRARARLERVCTSGASRGDPGLALLHAALGHELASPLFVSSVNCELLSTSIPVLAEMTDKLTSWATLAVPNEELQQLVANRLSAPSSGEIDRTVVSTREAVEGAAAVLRTLRTLTDDSEDPIELPRQLETLAALLRGYLAQWAELRIESASPTRVLVGRSCFSMLVTSLVAQAVDGIRRGGQPGTIVLRAFEEEEAVVIDVEHGHAGGAAETSPEDRALQLRARLAPVAERLQRAGGELFVDVTPERTRMRALLPAAPAAASDAATAGFFAAPSNVRN